MTTYTRYIAPPVPTGRAIFDFAVNSARLLRNRVRRQLALDVWEDEGGSVVGNIVALMPNAADAEMNARGNANVARLKP